MKRNNDQLSNAPPANSGGSSTEIVMAIQHQTDYISQILKAQEDQLALLTKFASEDLELTKKILFNTETSKVPTKEFTMGDTIEIISKNAQNQSLELNAINGNLDKLLTLTKNNNAALKYLNYLPLQVDSNQMVSRTPVYGARIRGEIKIVATEKDVAKVNQGDILVTTYIEPSMFPAMEKAAAIVIDKDDKDSHIRIMINKGDKSGQISRLIVYMEKPGITGAKDVITMFKDGDIVEVDAYTGSVSKLVPPSEKEKITMVDEGDHLEDLKDMET